MQRKKNIRLLIILITLMVVTTGVYFIPEEGGNAGIDRSLFTVDVSSIDKVVLESKDLKNILSFDGVQWQLNGQYEASPRMVTVLFSILSQVKAKRRAAVQQNDSLTRVLRKQGVKVSLYGGSSLLQQYYVAGNKEKTATYFMQADGEVPYLIHLPGYRTYIAQLFEMPAKNWRSRIAFPMNWRNLKSITTSYPGKGGEGFQILLDRGFLRMPQVKEVDTAKVSDYVQEVSISYLDEFIATGEDQAYDSLAQTTPELLIEVSDIGDDILRLELFPLLEGRTHRLGLLNDQDLCLFESTRIRKLFKTEGYFGK